MNIPSATVVRPEKCSVTIAGRKIKLRILAFGIIVILGGMIALLVFRFRNDGVQSFPSFSPSISLSHKTTANHADGSIASVWTPFSPDAPRFSDFLSFLKTTAGSTSTDDGIGASSSSAAEAVVTDASVSSSTSPDVSPIITDTVKIPGAASSQNVEPNKMIPQYATSSSHCPRLRPPHPPQYIYSERYPP